MNDIKNKFIKFINEYADELSEARKTNVYARPIGKLVRQEIVSSIKPFVNQDIYKVKGSVGAGRWTDVPWIAIFDKRITTSAQKGVYIVYLLNKDTKELFLTLNQGATEVSQSKDGAADNKLAFTGIAKSKNKDANKLLQIRAERIRDVIGNKYNLDFKGIVSGSEAYDAGCIFFKKYTIDTMPEDEALVADMKVFIDIYSDYYETIFNMSDLSKEQDSKSWLITWNPNYDKWEDYYDLRNQILSNNTPARMWACQSTKVSVGDRVYLMRIGVGDKNGIVASGIASSESYEYEHWDVEKAAKGEKTKRIDVKWDAMLDLRNKEPLKQDHLKKLMPLQQWSPQASGISIKDEYKSELESLWLNHLKEEDKEAMNSVKDSISSIKEYISTRGFSYEDGLIENFYLCLKSKPFVILAGTSGTGKTRLVKLFSEAIGANYKMIAVRPDWSDSSDLFGHIDLNGNYISGEILNYLNEARQNPQKPFVLCLDEMNLARVEYYMSDFLSIIETRDYHGDTIISDELLSTEKFGTDEDARKKYGEIRFPENLYLVGTVNMDETTFPFSKKVLDRANTIEFNYVDLCMTEFSERGTEPQVLNNSFLKSEHLFLSGIKDHLQYVSDVCNRLQDINLILNSTNAQVGYRIRDEIVFYMLNNKKTGLLSEEEAFDNEILQKILPRIQGSAASVKEMLCELFRYLAGDYEGYQTQNNNVAANMFDKIKEDGATYRKSAEKIAFMIRRFEEDGFTSYWL